MLDAMGSALSGLRAQSLKLNANANNIANSQSSGYEPTTVTLTEGEQGGVTAQVQKVATSAGRAAEVDSHLPQESKVDLAKEITSMMVTKRMYQANMKTVESSDELLGNLLDTLG